MGYLDNTSGYELTAKLTPQGRRKLITNTNSLITQFSLGDSDAYYGTYTGLTGGQVPAISGDNEGTDVNNGGANYIFRSTLNYTNSASKKSVNVSSISVNTDYVFVGYQTINYSGGNITQNTINSTNLTTDPLTNLYYSFGLPITSPQLNEFTGKTISLGGLANTALSGIAQTNVLVIGINDSKYSELIDGKSINLEMETSASTYNIYGTYQNKSGSLTTEDSMVYDSSSNLTQFGPNTSLLFSDDILKPNGGDVSKSWSTGYATNKPFSINNKEFWNLITDTNINLTADTPVGIAYLDKGFLVITEPTIVDSYNSGFSGATGTTITYDTVRNKVSQSITCIAGRGEFGISTNPSWSSSDIPRITELGLWDNTGTLIAVAKLNKTYYKPSNDFVAFNVTIDY